MESSEQRQETWRLVMRMTMNMVMTTVKMMMVVVKMMVAALNMMMMVMIKMVVQAGRDKRPGGA